MSKSYLTAIGRKDLPAPTKWLWKNSLLTGKILDFGCGRCHEINNRHFKADGFDPYFGFDQTDTAAVLMRQYDTIICNYVLCVIPRNERYIVLRTIQSLLSPKGIAYITVRNDRPRQGWGVSSKGTYQGRVQNLTLDLFRKTKDYRIYILTRLSRIVK